MNSTKKVISAAVFFFIFSFSVSLPARTGATSPDQRQPEAQEFKEKLLAEFDLTLNSFYLRNKWVNAPDEIIIDFKLSPFSTGQDF